MRRKMVISTTRRGHPAADLSLRSPRTAAHAPHVFDLGIKTILCVRRDGPNRELRALATAHRIELRVYDLVPNGHHDRITPYAPLRTHSTHEHSPCSWVTTAGDATQAWSYRCCGSTEPRRRRL